MSSTKPVVKLLKVSDRCLESLPCKHDVTVQYLDGTTGQQRMDAREIATFWSTLSIGVQSHLRKYKPEQPIKITAESQNWRRK